MADGTRLAHDHWFALRAGAGVEFDAARSAAEGAGAEVEEDARVRDADGAVVLATQLC